MTIGTLEQRRKELGLSNKALAVRLTELFPKSSGKAFSLETIEPRVSFHGRTTMQKRYARQRC